MRLVLNDITMVRLFYHSVKILLIALAIGALGSHFLFSPLSKPSMIIAVSIILMVIMLEFFDFEPKDQETGR